MIAPWHKVQAKYLLQQVTAILNVLPANFLQIKINADVLTTPDAYLEWRK